MCTDLFITLTHLGSFIPVLKNQLSYCCIISIFIPLLVSKWSYKYLLKTSLNVDMFDSNKSVHQKFLLLFATFKKQSFLIRGKSPYFPYNDQKISQHVWPFILMPEIFIRREAYNTLLSSYNAKRGRNWWTCVVGAYVWWSREEQEVVNLCEVWGTYIVLQ